MNKPLTFSQRVMRFFEPIGNWVIESARNDPSITFHEFRQFVRHYEEIFGHPPPNQSNQ